MKKVFLFTLIWAFSYLAFAQNASKLIEHQTRFAAGERGRNFLINYMDALEKAGYNTAPALDAYFEVLPNTEKTSDLTWLVLNRYLKGTQSFVFKEIVANINEYVLKQGVKVKLLILWQFQYDIQEVLAAQQINETFYATLKSELSATQLHTPVLSAEEMILKADMLFYEKIKDTQKQFETANLLAEKYYRGDYVGLNALAAACLANNPNDNLLEQAKQWAQRSVALKAEPSNRQTYALLLHRTHEKRKAIKMQKEALRQAKAQGEVVVEYEKNLKKIKKNY